MAPKLTKVHQDYLLVLDSRTAESYQIRIDNNSILGSDIGDILGPDASAIEDEVTGHVKGNGHTNGHTNSHANGHANGNTNGHANGNGAGSVTKASRKTRGLRIYDAGLENIAIMKSSITSMCVLASEQALVKTADKA
jgi:hypothetical protein